MQRRLDSNGIINLSDVLKEGSFNTFLILPRTGLVQNSLVQVSETPLLLSMSFISVQKREIGK